MKVSKKLKKELLRITGSYDENSRAVDEMNAILLQLTMALMMIFLIAFALFRIKTTEELEPIAQIKAEQQLTFQRQELIMALDRAEEYYTIRYGLKSFASVDDDDMVVYDAKPLIVDGALSSNEILKDAFVNGAKNSFADYSTVEELPAAWRKRVIQEASIDEESLQEGNEVWLKEQINQRINNMKLLVADIQYQAAGQIQQYLASNPTKVSDAGINSLLEQYINASADTKGVLINELDVALKSYAFNYLKQQVNSSLIKELDNE